MNIFQKFQLITCYRERNFQVTDNMIQKNFTFPFSGLTASHHVCKMTNLLAWPLLLLEYRMLGDEINTSYTHGSEDVI